MHYAESVGSVSADKLLKPVSALVPGFFILHYVKHVGRVGLTLGAPDANPFGAPLLIGG